METLVPDNGYVLVELSEDLVATPTREYSTNTTGIVRAVSEETHESLLNKRVFFDDFKDGTKVYDDGKNYTFIKYEDIKGHER